MTFPWRSVRVPEKSRDEALRDLEECTEQIERLERKRVELVGKAWTAGERRITVLERHAKLSSAATKRALKAWGIDPRTDRKDDRREMRLGRAIVAFAEHVQIADAEHRYGRAGKGPLYDTVTHFSRARSVAFRLVEFGVSLQDVISEAKQILDTPILDVQDAEVLRPLREEIAAALAVIELAESVPGSGSAS